MHHFVFSPNWRTRFRLRGDGVIGRTKMKSKLCSPGLCHFPNHISISRSSFPTFRLTARFDFVAFQPTMRRLHTLVRRVFAFSGGLAVCLCAYLFVVSPQVHGERLYDSSADDGISDAGHLLGQARDEWDCKGHDRRRRFRVADCVQERQERSRHERHGVSPRRHWDGSGRDANIFS